MAKSLRKQNEEVLIARYSTFAVSTLDFLPSITRSLSENISCALYLIMSSVYSDANYGSLGLMEQILSAFILMKSRLLGRDQTQKGSGGHYLACS
ncbi:hypothetical protein Pint_29241 [Pistacia integerrima]|uniref:Uncharacterized protein n=1 Tax=Pistacia integerrima TaxID=434235 RepID=A0ACC0WYL2_9ROSI|nr:hypothetical protein Pint_29241 [Pistacia integerrima]